MNPTQAGDLIKQCLLACGVSSTVIGYFTSEMWIAVGGLALTLAAAIWQFLARRTINLIKSLAKHPEVAQVIVTDPEIADEIPSPKVIAKEDMP
jgi:hypothetical protein